MKLSRGNMVALAGVAALLVGFFLPWVSVSVVSMSVNVSPMNITQYGTLVSGWAYLLYLIPVGAVASAVMIFLSSKDASKAKTAALVYIVAALVAGGILAFTFFQMQGQMSQAKQSMEGLGKLSNLYGNLASSISYGIGFWVSITGVVLLLVGGVMAMGESKTPTPVA